ncbi:hypothetical protein AJ80_05166 [Polytolypa hystricis UAMH7299]|uniref:Dolichyl-diphosphooligosaccharide--protein glycosyltransferase subunit 4 n=1 Tax=Polytolypa hystricis (strain UAMH7299) TaxID=1447883 RepID=A0A2B7Y657_POLH7|nr:hypothetical protein AJ80_05166 [Polytolypa hystricis UAMH7299]
MISDSDLYQLAIFLGSFAMLLIILYHYLEVNAKDTTSDGSLTTSSSSAASSSLADVAAGKGGVASTAGKQGLSGAVAAGGGVAATSRRA